MTARALDAAVASALNRLGGEERPAAEGEREALAAYLAILAERNAAMNLVSAAAAAPEALAEHLFDSLYGLSFLPRRGAARRLLDVGSGGGFPAVPLLVVRRDLEGTLVESVGKKAAFLEEAARRLALTVSVAAARFPDSFDMSEAPPFDVLTTRAVASAGRVVRAARPRLAPEGRALLWTTSPLVAAAVRESRARAHEFHPVPGTERRGILVLRRFT